MDTLDLIDGMGTAERGSAMSIPSIVSIVSILSR